MYSGTTITNTSGNLVGAHQKFDRVAYRALDNFMIVKNFPPLKQIIYFEGKNGPDGIKAKSPGHDEPDHLFDPFDPEDRQVIDLMMGHYQGLVEQLKSKNMEKAAFEASWLAHAIVDGLTPAHHFPYEAELAKLRGGEGRDTQKSVKEKFVMKGETRKELILNNWKMWGAKGLMTTHALFELGVASIIAPLKFKSGYPTHADLEKARKKGPSQLFLETAQHIASLNMYERFYRKGWTPKLAKQVRDELAPLIIQNVALIWALALLESGMGNKAK